MEKEKIDILQRKLILFFTRESAYTERHALFLTNEVISIMQECESMDIEQLKK